MSETYGYLTNPDPAIAAGSSFTPLVTATYQGSNGSFLGVYAHGGREELVVTASFNQYMQWFDTLAPGRLLADPGIELGYHRHYFAVQVDDIFLPDSRWSATGNCTPGDGCVDSTVSTTDIRMLPADVDNLVAWQNANKFKLDMVFNGGGSDLWKADTGAATDPLVDSYLANKAQFRWISHTYTHPFLGCIQIAATVVGGRGTAPPRPPRPRGWTPRTRGGRARLRLLRDGRLHHPAAAGQHHLGDDQRADELRPQAAGQRRAQRARDAAAAAGRQPVLRPGARGLGITWTASDASRETDTRVVTGGTTFTVPRHPTNIFYNAGTYQDEVDEYNWIYNGTTDGGSGICTANPATSTCIKPLDASSDAAAKTSFDSYIQPLEVRNALRYVLTNDPRPFYVHQSNLTEDRIVYPVLNGILAGYNAAFDAAKTPLVQTDLAGQGQALAEMNAWKAASKAAGYTDGYVDGAGVHLPAASVAVPLTVPTGSTGSAACRRTAARSRLGRRRQHRRSPHHRRRVPGRVPGSGRHRARRPDEHHRGRGQCRGDGVVDGAGLRRRFADHRVRRPRLHRDVGHAVQLGHGRCERDQPRRSRSGQRDELPLRRRGGQCRRYRTRVRADGRRHPARRPRPRADQRHRRGRQRVGDRPGTPPASTAGITGYRFGPSSGRRRPWPRP